MPVRIRMSEDGGGEKVAHPDKVQFGRRLGSIAFPEGLPEYDKLVDELLGYARVLLGREFPPLDSPYLTLAEVAAAYHSRAREIEMLIYIGENDGSIDKGSQYYKFRTGTLNSFIEMSKRQYDLGSRRLSQEDLLARQRIDQGEAQ